MKELITTSVGMLAAATSVASFLPQMIKTFRTKKAQDISILTFVVLFAGNISWLTYAILLHRTPVIISNVIGGFFSIIVLIQKIKYGRGNISNNN